MKGEKLAASEAFSARASSTETLLTKAGLYGRATDLQDCDAQFRKVVLPWTAGVYLTDEAFAALRVAGPNAGILQRATLADLSRLLPSDELFQRITGETGWTRLQAVEAGHFYLVDYKALAQLVPGTTPQQKYVFAPRALFYVPRLGGGRGSLRPVSIQIGQDASSPIFYPDGGLAWTLAKTCAAVNFPQRTAMSYTPAIPLAGFAPFPGPATSGAEATQLLDLLPPLNQSILQQAVLAGLGNVYYTVLGEYGGQLSDPRALLVLGKFQRTLQSIEKQIQAANTVGRRTLYMTLLPSAIPQSINI
jgi:hypothetical protein